MDVDGNPYFCKELIYKGERITCDPCMSFHDPLKLMHSLDTFEPRDDDIWLLSYVKSGTHWLNEILNILVSGVLTPAKTFKTDMFLEMMADINDRSHMQSPRIFNTHFRPKYLPEKILGKNKVIYIVRNPKSVAVSWYYHMTGITMYKYDGSFTGLLPKFVEGQYSIFGSWFEHVTEMWNTLKYKENALIIFYENLLENGASEIKKMADFLKLDRTIDFCSNVAHLACFDKMFLYVGKEPDRITKLNRVWADKESKMFRKGTITDWKNTFTVAQNEYFDKIFYQKMDKYPDINSFIKFEYVKSE